MDTIHSLELFKVPPRWLFLKITTKEGLVGWGEPIVEGKADTVAAAVKEFEPYLLGKDPSAIEDIFQMLYRGSFYRGGPVLMSAISGIEQALWDIKGKRLGVPVYDLMGGAVRDKMRVYSWVGGDEPDEVVAEIQKRIDAGFTHIKMNAVPKVGWLESPEKLDEIVGVVASIREKLGWKLGIGLDFHGRVRKGLAKQLVKAFEPYKPMFYEEPLLAENLEDLHVITQLTSIPIATGERMYGRWDFKQILSSGLVDILQPDLSHCGGIWEARKIAAMAEAYDVAIAPHCPLGPIGFAASLHLDFCTPNALIQECSVGIHYHAGSNDLLDYMKNPEVFDVENGYVKRNNLPGLGVDVDEEKVREAAKSGHNWHNPIWRNEDGSITEW
ncbi:MAG: galactonate dehydratase [Marinoscillum sp.]